MKILKLKLKKQTIRIYIMKKLMLLILAVAAVSLAGVQPVRAHVGEDCCCLEDHWNAQTKECE